jgi:hypothetical protein
VLRFLVRETTAQLDVHRVDRFRRELEATGLSPRSVNMMLDLLAQALDDAVEYGLLEGNPARGKRRRLKVPKASRSCDDQAPCARRPRRRGGADLDAAGRCRGGLGLLTAAVHLAVALDGGHDKLPAHPVMLLSDLARGRLTWTRYGTVVLLGLLLVAGLLAAGLVLLWGRRRAGGRVGDGGAHGARARSHGARAPRRHADRPAPRRRRPGLTLAKTVAEGRTLYQGW